MKWNLNLQKKMLIAFLGVGLIPMGIMGLIATLISESALDKGHKHQLESLESDRKTAVETYFKTLQDQIGIWAADPGIQEASHALISAYKVFQQESKLDAKAIDIRRQELSDYYTKSFNSRYAEVTGSSAPIGKILAQQSDLTIALQRDYISANPNPLGSKDQMDNVGGSQTYHRLHAQWHPFFHEYQQKFGLYDIFIIDPETGNVVYTVYKELDFATNLESGPWAKSDLANTFKASKNDGFAGFTHLTDFNPYSPSYEAPACFLSTPVFANGKLVSVLVFQLPLDQITKVMSRREGLGATGESYLVGPDFLPRSDTYLDTANRTVVKSYSNPQKGRIETEQVNLALRGKTGVGVFSNYLGQKVLASYAPVSLGGNTWAVISEVGYSEAFSDVRNLIMWTLVIAVVFGILITIIALFFTRSIAGPISQIILGLRQSSDEVLMASNQIAQTSQQLASGATEQAGEVQTVSSTMEEMSAMTKNNASNAQQVDQMIKSTCNTSETGLKAARNMADVINRIKDSSDETAKIIKNINAIAFQTNILSLNAAVEAARAGEAGAGFAVVADEVRNLAQNAAEAARDTEKLIEEAQRNVIQGVAATREVTGVLEGIKENIEKVTTLISEVSLASTEQASGIDSVTKSITQIDVVTQSSSSNAENTAAAAEELSAQTKVMNQMVNNLSALIESDKNALAENGSLPTSRRDLGGAKSFASKESKSDWTPAPTPKPAQSGRDLIPFDESELRNF